MLASAALLIYKGRTMFSEPATKVSRSTSCSLLLCSPSPRKQHLFKYFGIICAPNVNVQRNYCFLFRRLAGFLAGAFSRCQDELQSVRRRAGKTDVALALKALEATKAQLVNFSATCLMEVSNGVGCPTSGVRYHRLCQIFEVTNVRWSWFTPKVASHLLKLWPAGGSQAGNREFGIYALILTACTISREPFSAVTPPCVL